MTSTATTSPEGSFGARASLDVHGRAVTFYRLAALADRYNLARLPFAIKVLLENVLRQEALGNAAPEDVEALAAWDPAKAGSGEIPFTPARVLMQDLTGVPALVDLAAMRDALAETGGDPQAADPLIPTELVVDHSIVADVAGTPDAFTRNAALEVTRNRERYELLRWGQLAFRNLRVVPPNTGICHQVNLEHLARVVFVDADNVAYPDTVVGTDSHTTMVNGLGVLGWGVGGIEAEAAMLGQPIPLGIPEVVGLRLLGSLPEGTTATDLVLTVTERLRAHGVVGKLVEIFGPGVAALPLATRATISNMAPEFGSTCAIFPIDEETLRYLTLTNRPAEQIELVRAYAVEQGLWHNPEVVAEYSHSLELDLGTVTASLAGPRRPQDRVALPDVKGSFRRALAELLGPHVDPLDTLIAGTPEEASFESFPASDSPALPPDHGQPDTALVSSHEEQATIPERRSRIVKASVAGQEVSLDHGHVVIAAITSCTNTSNPAVMLAAGLVARKARARGLRTKPWVKASLAPGSRVVMDYYAETGLDADLAAQGFSLVGFGCTTCIGNSGPLHGELSAAVSEGDLAVCAVLSGNRNFEGRIHPDVRMNYLASPPLVVAYALAGTMDLDFTSEPLGIGSDGAPVWLRDIWPTTAEIDALVATSLRPEMFATRYAQAFTGDEEWQSLQVSESARFPWDPESTYVRRPPFLDPHDEAAGLDDLHGLRVLAHLGDSVTTDHISPAGSISPRSSAASYLREHGVKDGDFNSYGARRGNHEVMMRGTFANIRLRNLLAPGTEGSFTRHLPSGETMSIYDASVRYRSEGIGLLVLAGKEYGSGSSRDWAAKGPALLGVRAVLAQSFERIHRSNLIGMGVLPLQFLEGDCAKSLGLSGEAPFDICGLSGVGEGDQLPGHVTIRTDDKEFQVRLRIDTPTEAQYFRRGGILRHMLHQLRGDKPAT